MEVDREAEELTETYTRIHASISELQNLFQGNAGLYVKILLFVCLGIVFFYNFRGRAQVDIIFEWSSLEKGSVSWIAIEPEDYGLNSGLVVRSPWAEFQFLGQPSQAQEVYFLDLIIMADKKSYKVSGGMPNHEATSARIESDDLIQFNIGRNILGSGELVIGRDMSLSFSGTGPLKIGEEQLSVDGTEIEVNGMNGSDFTLFTDTPRTWPKHPFQEPTTRKITSKFVDDFIEYHPRTHEKVVKSTTELVEVKLFNNLPEFRVEEDSSALTTLKSKLLRTNRRVKPHKNIAKLIFSTNFINGAFLELPVLAVYLENTAQSDLVINGKLSSFVSPTLIIFDRVKPGTISLNSEKDRLRIVGSALEIEAGPDSRNLRPRKIDEWGWWVQALYWSILTLVLSSLVSHHA